MSHDVSAPAGCASSGKSSGSAGSSERQTAHSSSSSPAATHGTGAARASHMTDVQMAAGGGTTGMAVQVSHLLGTS